MNCNQIYQKGFSTDATLAVRVRNKQAAILQLRLVHSFRIVSSNQASLALI
ncbi:hypothetical protein GLIP_2775 [Aliiglaciecola lipolytica E3]|uniref:Uncharacterized protein n=1 Tax=Aliiglaciecola lipolytica E3 TaxID=1127673 RepID=K6XUR1_9ALTE|nr:hypothetical protein GLIP_2775 [Aliiglaciecola lipolytica E3]